MPYNFLGQHFEPVLAVFAGLYRLGAGVESLLIAQDLFVAAAAVPLYLATRSVTGKPLVGAAVVAGYLLNPTLHDGVFFGFHPEMMSLPFLFTALYFLVKERPFAGALSVAPILLLKEDMAIVLVAFAVLMWFRGFRRQGVALGALGVLWFVVIGVFVMAEFRGGGSSDLTRRFDYLVAGSDTLHLLPNALSRGYQHLKDNTLDSAFDILKWQGFLPLLSPFSLLALPSTFANGLSDHWQQSHLQLQYSTATLGLLWTGIVIGLGSLSRLRPRWSTPLLGIAAVALLSGSIIGFANHSQFAPGAFDTQLTAAHRNALDEAIALLPPDAAD